MPWLSLFLPLLACDASAVDPAPPAPSGEAVAIFAGGCFWCMEGPFDATLGVLETTSGYTGGRVAAPTYKQVSGGTTGHYEALRVRYDPALVSYEKLLEVFWVNVDPHDDGGQFCDRGGQYRAAIFVATEAERAAAEASKAAVAKRLKRPIVTPIEPAAPFWVAEDYHQDYYQTNPIRYSYYRNACGRDARLKAVWGEAAKH